MKTKENNKTSVTKELEIDIEDLFEMEKELKQQITPLKIQLRRWLQLNKDRITKFLKTGKNDTKYYDISWAMDKINRGYFGTDVHLSTMIQIIKQLKKAKLW
ncbi:MAG: hypothetical protein QQN41_04095 [Nitrosopumilus sp.]